MFFAPYVSLGVQKQMLLDDILKYREDKGSFPNNGSDFYRNCISNQSRSKLFYSLTL